MQESFWIGARFGDGGDTKAQAIKTLESKGWTAQVLFDEIVRLSAKRGEKPAPQLDAARQQSVAGCIACLSALKLHGEIAENPMDLSATGVMKLTEAYLHSVAAHLEARSTEMDVDTMNGILDEASKRARKAEQHVQLNSSAPSHFVLGVLSTTMNTPTSAKKTGASETEFLRKAHTAMMAEAETLTGVVLPSQARMASA